MHMAAMATASTKRNTNGTPVQLTHNLSGCAGIILCFYCFDLPQFRGVRMAAVLLLFLTFGAASLPLTYLLSFAFSDEMRALQVGRSSMGGGGGAQAHT